MKKLESDAQMWLIVVLAGFFFGFGWATGPAGWYFGAEMRKKYRNMGMEPAGNANLTYFGGIVSTVLYYGTILLTVALLVIIPLFFVGAVVTGAALQ
jgi:maltose-binding protein MalE